MSNVSIYLGVPPACDRCAENDAAVSVKLPLTMNYFRYRDLCDKCVVLLIQRGLTALSDEQREKDRIAEIQKNTLPDHDF